MKKKILLLLFLLLFCFVTTGCVKHSYTMEIDVEDNIKFSEIHAMNISALKNFGGDGIVDSINEQINQKKGELEAKGAVVDNYDVDDYKGLKVERTFTSKEFTKENLPEGFSTDEEMPIACKKGFFKSEYKVNLKFDLNQLNQNNGNNQGMEIPSADDHARYKNGQKINVVSETEDYNPATDQVTKRIEYEDGTVEMATYSKKALESLGNAAGNMVSANPGMQPIAELTMIIPGKVKENNATTVISEYEYKWNLTAKDQPVQIKITYEKTNWTNIIVIGIIGIILFKLIKRN